MKASAKCFLIGNKMILLTGHAIDQSIKRTGCDADALIAIITKAYLANTYYVPTTKPKQWKDIDQMWVSIDGPKGKGFAILVNTTLDRKFDEVYDWKVTTVCDSNTFTQSDRNERLTHSPFARLAQIKEKS
ncbi:MAG: hypothetical protein WC663_00425 [Patescibacteria group bacterium]|jgi:hypothetical protein